MASGSSKPIKVRFVIEPSSLKELEKIFSKFKLTWDDKIFKATDQLGGRLDKLSERVFKLNERLAMQNLKNQQNTGTGTSPEFDMDKFFNDFGKEMNKVTDGMAKAADAISKLKVNVTGSTGSIGDEKAERDASTAAALVADGQRKIAQQKLRDDNRKVAMAMDHRLKQERLMTRHMMSMFGGGLVSGQLGLVIKEVGGMVRKKFQASNETQEYLKTQEGQDTLAYAKADPNMRDPAFQGISKEWKDKGVSMESVEEADTKKGRAKSWMGRRVEGAATGDMSKLFGGKKGMLMAGGALAGVGILKKAISLGIESSPMMQQMLKLWKFGIMMIFRPIGDFFGFFLRPIFVMLLRKFIIPFYQEYLPIMQKLGNSLGEDAAKTLQFILDGIVKLIPLFEGFDQSDKTKYSSLDIGTAEEVSKETIAALDKIDEDIKELPTEAPLPPTPAETHGRDVNTTGVDAGGDETLVEQMKYILNPTSDTEYGGGSLGQDIYTAITEGLGIDDMDAMPTVTTGRPDPRNYDAIQTALDDLSSDIKIIEADNQLQRGDIIIDTTINVDGGNVEPEDLKEEIVDKVIEEVTRGKGRYS